MKFVVIDSKINITVTNGLTNSDKTNLNSRIGNNLNIKPLWTKTAVKIKKGKAKYPCEIADWESVKVLEAKDVFTIGREEDDGTPEEEALLKEFEASKAEVEAELPAKRRRKKADEAVTGE